MDILWSNNFVHHKKHRISFSCEIKEAGMCILIFYSRYGYAHCLDITAWLNEFRFKFLFWKTLTNWPGLVNIRSSFFWICGNTFSLLLKTHNHRQYKLGLTTIFFPAKSWAVWQNENHKVSAEIQSRAMH